MLLLRPDEQEMTAVHCRELSSPLSDDFVLMGGCSVGRWGVGCRDPAGASLGSGLWERKRKKSQLVWG